eukprot:m.20739 g.20739  ORF g.20739 m.20739 type:complete len:471 (+) comp3822_c0_seq2:91-1503(+)
MATLLLCTHVVLGVVGASVSAPPSGSAPSDVDASPRDNEDDGLIECPTCVHHTWEVLQAPGDPTLYPGYEGMTNATEVDVLDNGVERTDYGDGYGALVTFGGYSSTTLCTKYNRSSYLFGDKTCGLEHDWYTMWRPAEGKIPPVQCWIYDMIAYQDGNTLSAAPGTTTTLGSCPGKPGFKDGQYDWRYGGIRPQDNPDAALYPEIAKHIEDILNSTGKKVVIRGCSGGTINGYAFLMSQTKAWRQKHVMAFLAVAPVFGGTIESLESIVNGWMVGSGDQGRCLGRGVATHLPSVLWMWPHAGDGYGEWNKTEVLISTPVKNYTAYDLSEMLLDMGLPSTEKLYQLEKDDYLGKFEAPMIDTYVFYGYGVATIGGYKIPHNFSVDTDGPLVCPPSAQTPLSRPYDDGDKVAPRRSAARAAKWADDHAREGYVLRNLGYKGQSHSCSCTTPQCTADYNCILAKLQGKPHTGC